MKTAMVYLQMVCGAVSPTPDATLFNVAFYSGWTIPSSEFIDKIV